jgi:hypothetical protein
LGDVAALSGPGEVAFVVERNEIPQLREIHTGTNRCWTLRRPQRCHLSRMCHILSFSWKPPRPRRPARGRG